MGRRIFVWNYKLLVVVASILSPGTSCLDFDHNYQTPLSQALRKYFDQMISNLSITSIITNGSGGPETLWAWAADAAGAKITLFLPNKKWGDGWGGKEAADLSKIRKIANNFMWVSENDWSQDKETQRIKIAIKMSDIVFFIKNNINSTYDRNYAQKQIEEGLKEAQKLDKEIIIVKLSELL